MSLDLSKLAKELSASSSEILKSPLDSSQVIHSLISIAENIEHAASIISTGYSNTRPYLKAEVVEQLLTKHPLPSMPSSWNVVSADGSHIDIDRHLPVPCSLINMGVCKLTYGETPLSELYNEPTLKINERDLCITNPSNNNEVELLTGQLLSLERAIIEIGTLKEAVADIKNNLPTLALVDGSLILWGLSGQAYKTYVREHFIEHGLLHHMDGIKKIADNFPLSLAAYISFPRTTEVINSIRASICEKSSDYCGEHCNSRRTNETPCSLANNLLDRDLFEIYLSAGERSPIYRSQSSIPHLYYGKHQIYFFYINTGQEIGRVEIPKWVAENPQLLNLSHSLIFDQCKRGQGYPVAISESHEQAVLNGKDRELFKNLVLQFMQRPGIRALTSQKERSKRSPWL
ncbi:MAG TPA: hypothetical protein DEZ08_04320 [Dehalococcoidia bacterium]|jgi:hypothetical protein|nr:hypothetical protein [Dehalococcoidia bacterium]|tara:strand:+ start:1143 stop:2351 length:1209 start_codon:yes stop_codon:yes gene_type:complete